MLLEISGEITPEIKGWSQSKKNTQLWMWLVIEAKSNAVKSNIAYCTGTWNVRSMNQGTLEVVKQEMARVKVDILGISELKWNGMGEFNSDDHYIYYCGQETLRRNGVAIIVNKSPKWSTRMQFQKRQNDFCSFPRQTIQYHSNPSLCPNQECWRSWSWMVLWRHTRGRGTVSNFTAEKSSQQGSMMWLRFCPGSIPLSI